MKSSTSRLNYQEEEEIMQQDDDNPLDRKDLIRLIDEHLKSDDTQTATFWAEKLLAIDRGRTLNERLPQIAEYLAVLTAARAWQTIITLVERHDLFSRHMIFVFFNVNALFNREMFSEIIALPIGHLCRWEDVPCISHDSATFICAESDAVNDPTIKAKLDEMVKQRKYESRLLFLLAKTYLMVQNRPAAAACLRNCISSNPYCSEGLHLAIDSRLLKASELQEIVSSSQSADNPSGTRIISNLLEIYDLNREPSSFSSNSVQIAQMLTSDLSFQSANAFRQYSLGNIHEAYKITSVIMHEFGYYSKCFLVHVGCLVHLQKVSELYQLGHSMVKLQPEREITWYTVGCYYYATGQYTTAKKFLNKCTIINSGFGEGWLAYGHTLFYVEEHEQAMNCYLRASRILEGHFEPLLYIAVEYCFANNFKLATDFLHDAEMVAGANAIVLHEQGTAAFMEHEFKKAERFLLEALRLVTRRSAAEPLDHMLSSNISEFWEPLLNNLGHTLRKLGKFEQAIHVHRKSLLIGTTKADAWACIGVCSASMVADCASGEDSPNKSSAISKCIDSAIEAFNKALALRPGDDPVKMALEKVMLFASERTLQDSFPSDFTPDENFDTMVERHKQQQQQQGGSQQKRGRRAPTRGLDKLDPNTSQTSSADGPNSKTIGFPASCSSPMMEQQHGTSSARPTTTNSPIFSQSISNAMP